MKTLILAPGNPHIEALDVDGLQILASRPSPALGGRSLAEQPRLGAMPGVVFRPNGPPVRMDVVIADIIHTSSPGIFCKPHKVTFGRRPKAKRQPKHHIEQPANLPTEPAGIAGDPAGATTPTAEPAAEVHETLPHGDHEERGSTEANDEEVTASPKQLPAPGSEDGPGAEADEPAARIRLIRCPDALIAAGFSGNEVLDVVRWARGGAVVHSPKTGQEHIVNDSEYRMHYGS